MASARLPRIIVASRLALPSIERTTPSSFSKCSSSTWKSLTISMAIPAVPAIPTAEWSSVTKTFSMSRLATMLPIVARRSPARSTPSA